jgi:hypothetical protein
MNEEEKNQSPPSTDDSSQQEQQLNTPSTDESVASSETSTESEQPSTIEDMEVHHHTHHEHGKRNWKSYFWEFLMLFLAVFCGFLAEYQLEHTIEHQREKEYARALYDELYADSAVFAKKIEGRLGKEKDCDYLVSYIKDSSLTNLPKEFYTSFTTVFYLFTSYTFEPKDGVLNQLKGSGSLRYFKSASIQKLFGDLSVYINNVRDRNDQEYQFFASPIKPFILKHYDFNWMNELRKMDETAYNMDLIARYRAGNSIIKADILNLSSFDKGEVINMILFYKTMLVSTRTLSMKDYISTNQKLLAELRKEYHLK